MYSTKAYAAHTQNTPLALFSFARRDPTPNDVQIEILFCGVYDASGLEKSLRGRSC